jgi:serine/threonine-protein kinase RsbW
MPSRRDAVAPTVARVLELAAPAGLGSARLDDLAVALAEALSNAAVHGHRHRPLASVRIALAVVTDEAVVVDVVDTGAGFDHSALADPTASDRLLRPGGRGVYLMRQLADCVEYNASGNRVRLRISRNGDGR